MVNAAMLSVVAPLITPHKALSLTKNIKILLRLLNPVARLIKVLTSTLMLRKDFFEAASMSKSKFLKDWLQD